MTDTLKSVRLSNVFRRCKWTNDNFLNTIALIKRQRKRQFRRLWITRINAACRLNDITYSAFINALNVKGIELNRKVLADLALQDPQSFADLVNSVKN